MSRSILDMRPDELVEVPRFVLEELPDVDGRVSIYEAPKPGHDYAIGADFAYGIEGRDFDAAIVFDAHDDPPRQVGTLHGHWGERYDRVLYAAIRYWNDAFVLGERQVGLPILRTLLDEYKHAWLWYERDFEKRGKRAKDKLGWPKRGARARDPLLRRFRIAVRDRAVLIRDPALIAQCRNLQYTGPDSKEPEELTDEDLDIKLLGGGSPDLVMAGMYGLHAVSEMVRFEKPQPKYLPTTLGDILGHDELDAEPTVRRGVVRRPARQQRRRKRK